MTTTPSTELDLTLCNKTVFYERPPEICISNDMKLNQSSIITITVYFLLFLLSSIFNLTIIVYLQHKNLYEQSRIHKFMFQLIVADLMITFITIPLEIGWKWTVYWRAGDLACRVFQFLRPMGIYLGSFVIISLCIDRYYAIVHPLKIQNADFRTKLLIFLSWTLSIVCSIPQIFVFSLKVHPNHKWYTQCLDFRFNLGDDSHFYQIAFLFYQIFVSFITFFLPLIVIIITYSCIILKIIGKLNIKSSSSRSKKESNANSTQDQNNCLLITKNRQDTIKKAKRKTLKLAITIVIVFLICWTPYYFISVLFWIDPNMSYRIDDRIYNFLFIFAVSNCLANPLVYGLTSIKIDAKKLKFTKK